LGSHSLQAVALTVFLIAFTTLCAGLAAGGSIPLVAIGVALLAASAWLFLRCRQMEESQG
jgi:hypothetical protein